MSDNLKDQMKADAGAGFEKTESQDFSAPWLILLQTNSPQLDPGSEQYVESARPGRIFSVSSGNCYEQCNVIPIRYEFRNVEWRSRKAGGGFISSYTRATTPSDLVPDPLRPARLKHGDNEIMGTAYYLLLLKEEKWNRVILPLASTQLKKSKQWQSVMVSKKIEGTDDLMPIFANVYTLSVVRQENSQGKWFGWRIEWSDVVSNLQLYNHAKEVRQQQVDFLPTQAIAYNKVQNEEEVM